MKKSEQVSCIYKKNRLQQIKGFFYAAKFKNISKAARVLGLAQSTITLQIQSLERDLGLKLLNRSSNPFSLTNDGEEFFKIACPLMHEFESVIEKFLDQKNEKEQLKIEIAMHHIAISYLMPKAIKIFKKKYPLVKIVVRNILPYEANERLINGEIDLAFYPNMQYAPEIEHIETISYDPVLIMNKDHSLAKKKIGSLRDLQNFDLIRIDKSAITLPLFEDAVRSHGLQGSVEFENGNWEMIKHFVRENNFVAVVSTICIGSGDEDLITKNLEKFFPKMSYTIMHRKGEYLKPIVSAFIDSLKQANI